jgi:predicted transposase YbfD/YdcC
MQGWLDQLLGKRDPTADQVSADGKELLNSQGAAVVSACSVQTGRWLGLEPVAEGSNEIPAARNLLRRVDLDGTLVTNDAMHRQPCGDFSTSWQNAISKECKHGKTLRSLSRKVVCAAGLQGRARRIQFLFPLHAYDPTRGFQVVSSCIGYARNTRGTGFAYRSRRPIKTGRKRNYETLSYLGFDSIVGDANCQRKS